MQIVQMSFGTFRRNIGELFIQVQYFLCLFGIVICWF
jgi:hypothetical protein